MNRAEDFWHFVAECELIHDRAAANEECPYTTDPRLRDYWFPNIRRCDGRLVRWWRDAIANADISPHRKIQATIAAWLIVKVSTLEEIKPVLLDHGWDSRLVLQHFGARTNLISRDVPTGILPPSLPKVCEIMEEVIVRGIEFHVGPDIRGNTNTLRWIRGIGGQLAFEIACALQYLVPSRPTDWIYAGRSTVSGAGAFMGLDLNPDSKYGREAAQALAIALRDGGATDWQLEDAQKALELFHYYVRPKPPRRRYRCR